MYHPITDSILSGPANRQAPDLREQPRRRKMQHTNTAGPLLVPTDSNVLLLYIAAAASPWLPAAIRSCQVGLHGLHVWTAAPPAHLHASSVRRRSQSRLSQRLGRRFRRGQRGSPTLHPFAAAGGRPLGRRLLALGGCEGQWCRVQSGEVVGRDIFKLCDSSCARIGPLQPNLQPVLQPNILPSPSDHLPSAPDRFRCCCLAALAAAFAAAASARAALAFSFSSFPSSLAALAAARAASFSARAASLAAAFSAARFLASTSFSASRTARSAALASALARA